MYKRQVYDVSGKVVTVLQDGYKKAGEYSVVFDGSGFSSGMYIYRLEGKDFSETKRMILIK